MHSRFAAAIACYAALAIVAALTLDRPLREAVVVLMIGLAVKTWIAWKQQELRDAETNPLPSDTREDEML